MPASRPMCAQWFMEFHPSSDSTPGAHYVVRFIQGSGPTCTCPSFQRSQDRAAKRPGWIPACKHVVRVMAHACLWNQHYDGGDRTMEPIRKSLRAGAARDMRCPACGGPVVQVTEAHNGV